MKSILPCPFCGEQPKTGTKGGSDERCGYNFTAFVKCCATLEVTSLEDKHGWCCEQPDSAILRAITKWNKRS